jgi:hypothetical protein
VRKGELGASPTARKPGRGNGAATSAPSGGNGARGQKWAWELGVGRRGLRRGPRGA